MSSGPADKVLDPFKSLVFDEIIKLVIAKIVGLAPFLAFGPVAFIVGKLVTYLGGLFYEAFRDIVNIRIIMLNNEIHHAEFMRASDALTLAFDKYGLDSPEFRKVRDERKKALAQFVRYSGT